MTTFEDIETNNLLEDSEYYAEKGYCITPEEHIKEANNAIIQLTKENKELKEACSQTLIWFDEWYKVNKAEKCLKKEDFYWYKKLKEVQNAKH